MGTPIRGHFCEGSTPMEVKLNEMVINEMVTPEERKLVPKGPGTQRDMPQCFLGIDVGYSRRRPTTGLCLITIDQDRFQWQCHNTWADGF